MTALQIMGTHTHDGDSFEILTDIVNGESRSNHLIKDLAMEIHLKKDIKRDQYIVVEDYDSF